MRSLIVCLLFILPSGLHAQSPDTFLSIAKRVIPGVVDTCMANGNLNAHCRFLLDTNGGVRHWFTDLDFPRVKKVVIEEGIKNNKYYQKWQVRMVTTDDAYARAHAWGKVHRLICDWLRTYYPGKEIIDPWRQNDQFLMKLQDNLYLGFTWFSTDKNQYLELMVMIYSETPFHS